MTQEEAKKVISICLAADRGCPTCARVLIRYFIEAFPEYAEQAKEAFEEEYAWVGQW